MRDVAIVSTAQLPAVRNELERQEPEWVAPVITEALEKAGLRHGDPGFICSGSSDYLIGRPFSFVSAVAALGVWPPAQESHVEMDGAWALYEAWVRLQHGDIDTALVYAFGQSSAGDIREVLVQQLDPYYMAPLGPDSVSLAALQARAVLDAGLTSEEALAAIANRSRESAKANPNAQLTKTDASVGLPYLVEPLRKHDCGPISDASCAIVLAAGDAARRFANPAWISGIDHRVEPHAFGARDLTTSASTATAAERAGVFGAPIDTAELHAPFTHQEVILRNALRLDESVNVNPSGGALAANPVMVAGLIRMAEAANRISAGDSKRALAHATSGPLLQQNLVAVLEASARGDRT